MIYRTILIDDEPDCLGILNWQIEKYCPQLQVVATCDDARQGPALIDKLAPEVVFLDIEMPFMNGFELLRRVKEFNFEVVFTTAHDEYALKALKLNAIDYLLKPISKADLKTAVEKVQKRLNLKSKEMQQAKLTSLHNLSLPSQQKIAIPLHDSILFFNIEEILYVESEGNYSTLYIKNKKPVVTSKTLRHFEDLLSGYSFFRVHASYLINLAEVAEFRKTDGGSVVMSNGAEVKISRSRKDEFLKLL
jgi:two-component system LytT family response regulator